MKKWSEICENVSITHTIAFKSKTRDIKPNMVRLTIEIPIEYAQDFRRHIEVPTIRGRRKSDQKQEDTDSIFPPKSTK